VKTVRVPLSEDLEWIRKVSINDILVRARGVVSTVLFQRFYREVVVWSALSHPNVLELVGVQEDTEKRQFTTVLKWMGHGNIMEFIGANRSNRLELVCDSTSSTTRFTEMGR